MAPSTVCRNTSHCLQDSPFQDYTRLDDHTQPTYDVAPGMNLFS